jgi:hypothetical protein
MTHFTLILTNISLDCLHIFSIVLHGEDRKTPEKAGTAGGFDG